MGIVWALQNSGLGEMRLMGDHDQIQSGTVRGWLVEIGMPHQIWWNILREHNWGVPSALGNSTGVDKPVVFRSWGIQVWVWCLKSSTCVILHMFTWYHRFSQVL